MKPTIAELEKILDGPPGIIRINPDGSLEAIEPINSENIAFQKGKIQILHDVALKVATTIPGISEGYKKAKKELRQIQYICNRACRNLEEK